MTITKLGTHEPMRRRGVSKSLNCRIISIKDEEIVAQDSQGAMVAFTDFTDEMKRLIPYLDKEKTYWFGSKWENEKMIVNHIQEVSKEFPYTIDDHSPTIRLVGHPKCGKRRTRRIRRRA